MAEFKTGDRVRVKVDRDAGALSGCTDRLMNRMDNATGTVVGFSECNAAILVKCDFTAGDFDDNEWYFYPHELEPLNND